MVDDIKALRAATNGQDICRILTRIEGNIKDLVLCDQYVSHGFIEILRDLVSSLDLGVCSLALSLIAQLVSNNDDVNKRLCKPMGFLHTLAKLCHPFDASGQHHKKFHLALHNQAVTLIKKLVLNPDCMPEVASVDLIGQMIELCGIFFHDSQHAGCCRRNMEFPPNATAYFHSLVHGTKLVGRVKEMLAEASKKAVEALKIGEIFEKDVCVLSVDLYNTTTDEDIAIKDELVKEGMAWPQFLSPEKQALFAKENTKGQENWADVTVTSVIDGRHFWAQVGGEIVDKKLTDIRLALQKQEQVKCTTSPGIGELVCCRTMLGGHPDYFRAKVLQALPTQDGVMLEVFAVDYGCTNVVPLDSVSRLTQLRRKEPYQARLCRLTGIQPPAADVKVLVNTVAALRNLAYRSNASRLQILEKNGIDALLKLLLLPDKEIRKQVIGAILNLSVNFKTRERIGFLGGIKMLLDSISTDFKDDDEVAHLAVGSLRNLMLASHLNRARCADEDGLFVLTNAYFASKNNDVKQQCLGALKNLIGNCWYMLTGTGNAIDFRSIIDESGVQVSYANEKYEWLRSSGNVFLYLLPYRTILQGEEDVQEDQLRSDRHIQKDGEVEPQPIEKALPSHVIKAAPNQVDTTDCYSDEEEKMLSPLCSPRDTQDIHVKFTQEIESFYVRGEAMPFNEDDTHEFRYCKETRNLSSTVVTRPACAFLNAGKGGTVYLGVKKSGVICGVEMSRSDRDRLRVGVDETLGEFKPAVKYDKYQVNFVPVADERRGQRRKDIEFISDVFVVEITFAKCSGTVYTTSKHRCYFRCGSTNSEYSIQDVRKWVIREQESFYNDQINILKRELSAVKQKLQIDEG